MNNELLDFMADLREAETTEQAGTSFIRFSQRTGACVVHTFFGTAPDKQSISTLPAAHTQEEGRTALIKKSHLVEPIRAGVPRNIWGVDFQLAADKRTRLGEEVAAERFRKFRQRSSLTFSMPNADGTYSGAGIGIGFEDTGPQFLRRISESGGAFAVASFAAYAQMLTLSKKADRTSPLSRRQTEILQLLAAGFRLGDISDKLNISDSAVNLYLANLRSKLNVNTKEQALAMAISNGWIKP